MSNEITRWFFKVFMCFAIFMCCSMTIIKVLQPVEAHELSSLRFEDATHVHQSNLYMDYKDIPSAIRNSVLGTYIINDRPSVCIKIDYSVKKLVGQDGVCIKRGTPMDWLEYNIPGAYYIGFKTKYSRMESFFEIYYTK